MYRPAAFAEERLDILYAAIRAHPLATLVTQGEGGLSANLVPFTLEAEGGKGVLRAHLAKANSQLADLRAGGEALVIFQGPQAYVTPSWYPSKQEHGKAVPTWNYVMVQVRGRPRVIDDAGWLREQIGALTGQQERDRLDPWTVEEAPADFIAALIGGLAGLEIPIDRIEGKWKVSQNQPAPNHQGVIDGLKAIDPASPMATVMEMRGRG